MLLPDHVVIRWGGGDGYGIAHVIRIHSVDFGGRGSLLLPLLSVEDSTKLYCLLAVKPFGFFHVQFCLFQSDRLTLFFFWGYAVELPRVRMNI